MTISYCTNSYSFELGKEEMSARNGDLQGSGPDLYAIEVKFCM